MISKKSLKWEELYEVALRDSRPEPYGKNSNFVYSQLGIPISLADAMSVEDKLPTDGPERRKILKDLLISAQQNANEVMMGIITPQEKVKRRIIAGFVLAGILLAFSLVFRSIYRTFSPKDYTGKDKGWQFKKYFWAYVLLLPAVLTILVWNYVPLARGSVMAFQNYKVLGDSAWIGLDNFGNLIVDSAWWSSIWNAMRYSLLVLALTFLPPIILAVFLQEIPKGKLLFRMIYYLPAVISGLVTMVLWKQFYEPSEFGVLNKLVLSTPAIVFILFGGILAYVCFAFARRLFFYRMLLPMWAFILAGGVLFYTMSTLSFPVLFPYGESFDTIASNFIPRLFEFNTEPYRWLYSADTAMIACVIPMVWAGVGPGCLIYLAALKGIPDDYYEAADIDGATFIDKILFVVFPTLKALIIINFVGAFISSWYSSTGNILVMTGGDVASRTETAGLYIWYKAFTYLNFGSATAAAWMLAFFLIGFTVYQLRILARVEFKANTNDKK